MLTENTRRGLLVLAMAVIGMLTLGRGTPAHAACSAGAPDKPDLGFVDSNCDGIDGDKAAALFVAPAASGGNDANDGSFGHPMASVVAAVKAALPAGKDVYVAAGVYDGKVNFLAAPGHIGLYGGYNAATWQRSAANVTTIQAPGQVIGISIPGVVLQLVSVHSVSGPTYLNSYGVRAFGTGSVALSRVSIQTAPGAAGTDGAAPPAPPAAAPDGKSGVVDCLFFGGAGGDGGPRGLLSGGTGGAAWNQTQPWKGFDGASDPGVQGGWGGQYVTQNIGQDGGQGAAGIAGTPGQGGSASLTYTSSFYLAMSGSPGGKGTRGAGGGGGAAGEACLTGSGGGAGGAPGAGGVGGGGGGGSIGVFAGAGAHVLVLDGTTIHTADGGRGGVGGTYQEGGAGGNGPEGVVRVVGGTYYKSGAGGDGGYGGHGGQGGGGAGGASIGILAIDASTWTDEDTTKISVGAGGPGGTGGVSGKNGVSSLATQVTTPGGSIPPIGDFDGDGVADDADACPIVAAPGGCAAPDGGGTQAGGTTPTGGTTSGGTTSGGTTGGSSGTTASGSTPVTVHVLPKWSCLPRGAFTIRINARRAHLKRGRLTLDGRRLRLVKGPRIWKARVNLSRSTRTRHTLTIRGTLRSGRSFKQTRRYRTCAR
jgi:hypothetical protein